MEHADLLRHLSVTLQRLDVRHFITGSTATIFFGEPRFTTDIDVVVDLSQEQLAQFLAAFPPGEFYFSEPAARAALTDRGQFNIIHPESGLKIDVIFPADTPHNPLTLRSRPPASSRRLRGAIRVTRRCDHQEDGVLSRRRI